MQTTTYLSEGTLRHGLRVAVRPLEPGDRMDLVDGFHHLSEESRYRRFLSAKRQLTSAEIRQLFETEELALVLVWQRNSCKDVVLGIAHAFRLPEDPETAEYSIAITDEIHGKGAGRMLTESLAHTAKSRGIERFTATMLGTNAAPARLLAGVGEILEDECTMGTREMTVRLK